ncbi:MULTISPECIES: NifX-associated nitrogen fixation protein [unclassified Bradyrhizobium]|uniref:NifX-associated nitrogen fixation protein n=1 Tax=unclassified Bradyrhizobium TaxID=2631580 RepID=UPI001CD49D25|nr:MULTISPECIES: NifX-associated nitrogen fixation protein [unclassified Bradyrhizobium]MCA1384274.1 NifX-associated nitrogen fixation protein [Bradyrhizobium sp. BRP05]MCA1393597.1 NifX-associated nitrogen fixation protein [Bradyrhizobium sp. IC3123]MCA1421016.1 NifX-associated nitrogen fixation protein [Bradyrhizobium sp. BRP23]MCA1430742.1 NifX-associated nitrogen fixation protein [Bradyrhizobium sp. NBAIM16]MCA1479942.1 NifX-associated nitrogen fixation protein [Bradyrhizobium sp. NBAIM08]
MTAKIEQQGNAADAPFLVELIKVWRAQDTNGALEARSDLDLLELYILDKEKRRALPIIGDPDPDPLWRLKLFFDAVALSIERETGAMTQPILDLHHEGFARMVLISGRLIAVNKQLRDVYRFGFDSLVKLAQQGDKCVSDGIGLIRKFPDVANYWGYS